MLTPEEDVEITSLKARGWTISAIARHVGHDRKTVRAYLSGERESGVRVKSDADVFDRFEPYVRQRLADDPHVWATTLFDELVGLGFDRSYQTFTRQLRDRDLRPHCEPCSSSNGRAHVDIDHPPGEEIQWDWLELTDTPWGAKGYVLVGALAHSSRFRCWFSESDDQAHLVVGLDEVLRRIGGTTRRWRFDRMATVVSPGTGRIQRSFAPVAKHYGAGVDLCPPRHGNRKGVVEKAIHFLTQRWWRTARISSPPEAQASLDRFCVEVADLRPRPMVASAPQPSVSEAAGAAAIDGVDGLVPPDRASRRVTVADLAEAEPLFGLPAARNSARSAPRRHRTWTWPPTRPGGTE